MRDVARLLGRRQPARALRPLRRAAAVLAVPVVVAAGCSGGPDTTAASTTVAPSAPLLGVDTPLSVPPTLPLPADYELDDTRDVELRPAMGRPPTGPPPAPVAMTGGSSRLAGVARGPDGPVAGATVRIERFVEDRVGRVDTTTGADGTFAVRGLPGGRYRVRAWLRPFLTATTSQVTFLAAAGGEGTVQIDLERHNAMAMQGTVGVRGWQIGQRAGVSVLVTQEYVDDDGIARTGGVAGASIALGVPAGLALLSEPAVVTGNDGYARFGIECLIPGQYQLLADSGALQRTITVPTCVAPPPPTTQPPPPGPEVGQHLSVPGAGPFAAGSYIGSAPTCVTVYEVQAASGDWVPATAGALLSAPGLIRNLQPGPGTGPCVYRRTA